MKTRGAVFHILDLDRTLFNTVALAHKLKEVIAQSDPWLVEDIDGEIMVHQYERTSFFIFDYIATRMGEEKLEEYVRTIHLSMSPEELLLPGAKERIEYAKSQPGWGVGILTYGAKRGQMIKLKLANLQMERHLITDSPRKSEVIASWQQPDGRFKLPIEFGGHTVDILTLDDDKHLAFENLPENVYGQWISHASIGGVSELQSVGQNVKLVDDLFQSVEYLKTKLNS